jgi:hypothetical protein
MLPDVNATRRAHRATLTRAGFARTVKLADNASTYWIVTKDAGAPMAALCDGERHDIHAATTFARTIAGGYDAALSRPDY